MASRGDINGNIIEKDTFDTGVTRNIEGIVNVASESSYANTAKDEVEKRHRELLRIHRQGRGPDRRPSSAP